jgi:hypothetical protein
MADKENDQLRAIRVDDGWIPLKFYRMRWR